MSVFENISKKTPEFIYISFRFYFFFIHDVPEGTC